jgi:hypothetical protein
MTPADVPPLQATLEGGDPPSRTLDPPAEYWVGRDDVIDLRSTDLRVSRRHATIGVRDGRWWFVDRSSGGSFTLEGEVVTELAITARTALRLGDKTGGPILELEPVVPAVVEATPPRGLATEILSELEDRVEIGRGGFAVVYRAFQPEFGRTVAVKVIEPGADKTGLGRFDRERVAMGALSAHPNIVTVFDAGVTPDGSAYLLMEYMPDGSLDKRVERSGPLPWAEVLDIGIRMAGALHTAHEADILHRDVKPANILVSSYGEACLSDFGLARLRDSQSSTGVTATVMHAPPEILDGKPALVASDIYSLGSTLFTLVTGSAPFEEPPAESVLALVTRIARAPVPDLRPAGVPAGLCSVIERALDKDPARRYRSAQDMGLDLQRVQREHRLPPVEMRLVAGAAPSPDAADSLTRRVPPAEVEPPGATPTEDRRHRRRWPWVVGLLVAVAAAVTIAVLVLA